jgi:hypothetical protein
MSHAAHMKEMRNGYIKLHSENLKGKKRNSGDIA